MVGGAAYYAGRKVAQGENRESEQEERMQALEYQQQQMQMQQMQAQQAPQHAPPPQQQAAPPQTGPTPSMIEQLTDLKKLLDAGVLTQAEFDLQKTKILQSS
jgi:hypothetical protein